MDRLCHELERQTRQALQAGARQLRRGIQQQGEPRDPRSLCVISLLCSVFLWLLTSYHIEKCT